ncbi:hypothetical protein ACLMAJ_01380 [Nocardia sp. KC 131]|uniref:hypothetical protein n=1 Tax=Nocardia arseniciresistens TaxID=3392119 RepID=UPI00398F16A6
MSAGLLVVVIAVIVIAVAAGALGLWPMQRSRRLRSKFGPEYDRTVEESEDRRRAERELAERERRHSDFDLRELSDEEKQRYVRQWAEVQERFVDTPAETLTEADRLVTTVMAERGYPTEDYDQRLADLSVQHATVLGHYRTAHEITTRQADLKAQTGSVSTETMPTEAVSTEDMRTAIVHYRELFQDLLDGRADTNKDAVS